MELPQIKVCGEMRSLRRWGLSDVFKLQRVLGDLHTGAALRQLSLEDINLSDPGSILDVVGAIAAGLSFAENSISDWVYSWYEPALDSAEELPLEELMDTLIELVDHPDVTSFLSKAGKLIEKLSEHKKTNPQ